MPRIPEVSASTGLRRLAMGGVSVTSAYQQMAQNLDKALGPGAGLFLAEPVEREDKIDWYTAAEGPARRLAELDEPERKQAGQKLRETLDKMAALARQLKEEKDDYRSHLGHLIELAIQIPDERHVWMIGDQPVLTFWGTTREVGQPVESPVYKLVPPKQEEADAAAAGEPTAGGSAGDTPPGGAEPASDAAVAAAAAAEGDATDVADGGGAAAVVAAPVRDEPPNRAALILLWLLFALIIFAIGFELLRSCALSIPWFDGKPLVNFCVRPGGEEQLITLFNERERLESERRLLLEQIGRERQMCEATKQPPTNGGQGDQPPGNGGQTDQPPGNGGQTDQPPSNGGQTDQPPSNGQNVEPPQNDPPTLPQFAGCWGTSGAPITLSGVGAGGQPLSVDSFLCFDTGKRGRYAMKGGQWSCTGDGSVEQATDQAVLKFERITCPDGSGMSKTDWTCKAVADGSLTCTEVEYPNGEPEPESGWIRDQPFHHVEGLPQ